MSEQKIIKTIFCVNEQKETQHVLSANANGEIIATCDCGKPIKFPAGIQRDEFNKLIAKHKESNEGQISVESINATLQALADDPKEEQPIEEAQPAE